MKVVLLVGGRGSRMSADAAPLPKVLHEIGPFPILWHLMRSFLHAGHSEFVLCLGWGGDEIVRHFAERPAYLDADVLLEHDGASVRQTVLGGAPPPWRMVFARTGLEATKVQRLLAIRQYLGDETFLCTYGDGLADINVERLLAFHRAHGKAATLTAVRARSQYGHVALTEEGAVTGLEEKPALPGWVNGGFFVLEPRAFEYLRPDDDELETESFARLSAAGELMAYRHTGFWACMDTNKDNLALNALWATGQAPWKTW